MDKPTFGRRGRGAEPARRPTKLEREQGKPFTLKDIEAHINGTAPHNDLNDARVRGMVNSIQEIIEKGDHAKLGGGDNKMITKWVGVINELLGRTK